MISRKIDLLTKPEVLVVAKFGGKVTHGPRTKPLGLCGNLDQIMLCLELV